jgi:hypothetical protein
MMKKAKKLRSLCSFVALLLNPLPVFDFCIWSDDMSSEMEQPRNKATKLGQVVGAEINENCFPSEVEMMKKAKAPFSLFLCSFVVKLSSGFRMKAVQPL